MRRKGELSPAGIDRGWPHQVALPARFSVRGNGYKEIHEFCKDLTLCNRGHAVCHDNEWFNIYCFEKRRTPINSCKSSAARSLIRNNEGRVVTGRVGISPRLPT